MFGWYVLLVVYLVGVWFVGFAFATGLVQVWLGCSGVGFFCLWCLCVCWDCLICCLDWFVLFNVLCCFELVLVV